MKHWKYVFGPVPSRRFGRSLGVDLVPVKTCPFNCLFCQLGPTTSLTAVRREYVPFKAVTAELTEWLASGEHADHITLAGSGEPTLYSRLGELLDFVRSRCRTPSVLLSNGALFSRADVRADAAKADIVKVSLSAWDQASLEAVNKPGRGIRLERILDGLRTFREQFHGRLCIEVFAVDGVNSSAVSMRKIAALASSLRPDAVHLNTSVRPVPGSLSRAVPAARLVRLAGLFTPPAEVIAPAVHGNSSRSDDLSEERIVALLSRHPTTAAEMTRVFGATRKELQALLKALLRSQRVRTVRKGGRIYYACP